MLGNPMVECCAPVFQIEDHVEVSQSDPHHGKVGVLRVLRAQIDREQQIGILVSVCGKAGFCVLKMILMISTNVCNPIMHVLIVVSGCCVPRIIVCLTVFLFSTCGCWFFIWYQVYFVSVRVCSCAYH